MALSGVEPGGDQPEEAGSQWLSGTIRAWGGGGEQGEDGGAPPSPAASCTEQRAA
jgi:hypothetical protein